MAEKHFQKIVYEGEVSPDIATINIMIDALAFGNSLKKAETIWDKYRERFPYNSNLYSSIIEARCNCNALDNAFLLFKDMISQGTIFYFFFS